MRHNLAGRGYKTSADSESDSSGCPSSVCRGYELTRDLDFDVDGDGTWSRNDEGSYTLDADDRNDDYFPVNDDDGTGGGLPIGDDSNPFVAVFDGNGHTISNLAIRRDQAYVGLFGAIGEGAAIRNLGLIDNLADYSGSSDFSTYIGGLVGYQETGSITAGYATGAAAGGDGSNDHVGGPAGWQHGGSITASYATGAADGGHGDNDRVGGLVGHQEEGLIMASSVTGAVDGGEGDFDIVGGLVGLQEGGSITASYGFGEVMGEEVKGSDGSAKPQGVGTAAELTAANAGAAWGSADSNTLGAWDFGTDEQIPVLNYADYGGGGGVFDCEPPP